MKDYSSFLVLLFSLAMFSSKAQVEFGPPNIISYNDEVKSIINADLDGDGDPDIVAAFEKGSKIAWFENLGNEMFSDVKVISTSAQGAYNVFAADLDGDGDNDVMSASKLDHKIAWYENLGSGEFSSEHIISVNAYFAHCVYATDLDGDGDNDVLSASNLDDKIAWYENMGGGEFSSEIIISSTADGANCVYAADLDGDGDNDVLSASENDNKIAWYENLGDGVFAAEDIISSYVDGATCVYASDLDGDGDNDIVAAAADDHMILWWENSGIGFGWQNTITDSANSVQWVYAADLDSDGDQEVMAVSYSQDHIAWYDNLGSGEFSAPNILTSSTNYAASIFASDIDADGDIDIISASLRSGDILWYKNLGDGLFSSPNVILNCAYSPTQIYAADLDDDGDSDMLVSCAHGNKVVWYENLGGGILSSEKILSDSIVIATSVLATDLDGDGDLDVLSTCHGEENVVWFENMGSGVFSSENFIPSTLEYAGNLYATDLDGDGDIDVMATGYDSMVTWYENVGDGVFESEIIISDSAIGPTNVFAADLDNDGDNDLLTSSYFAQKIVWYENTGSGMFSAEIIISDSIYALSGVYAIDLNEDGDVDILSTRGNGIGNGVSWYENLGSGLFSSENIISTTLPNPGNVFSIDLDSDGDNDILTTSTSADIVVWFQNLGDGVFSSEIIITTSAEHARSVFATDFDGDGDNDVMFAAQSDSQVGWHENLFGEGCTNGSACNYDPEAFIDDGGCCLGICGCMDSFADNYYSLAQCDDSSCVYTLNGSVFYDEDENGILDSTEFGLPYREVVLQPLGWNAMSDDLGQYSYVGLEPGSYSVEVITDDNFPYYTTINPQDIDIIPEYPSEEVALGLSHELPEFAAYVVFYSSVAGYPCNDWVTHNIGFRNEGNLPIDGVLEVEFNPLFQDYSGVTPIDSVVDNRIYMGFENLNPGQMFYYEVDLLTPTTDYIGEYITSTSRVYGHYDGVQVAYGERELTVQMTCSYDPNDKQVFPNGYGETHFILNETELEYLIRFQNTGNASATNVLVTDTIDENLNLETFQLNANSHSVMTTIKPDERVIEFFFENIMLPDSTSNEPESHGLVSYLITPDVNLEPGTELNNTGNIFFDNNPPIITNTTWSTIFHCDLFQPFIEVEENVLTASEGLGYQWYLNGVLLVGDSLSTLQVEESGLYQVQVNGPFDCVKFSDELFITPVSLDEHNMAVHRILPNPMTDSSVLVFDQKSTVSKVDVFNTSGSLVRTLNVSGERSIVFDREQLAKGTYILSIVEKFGSSSCVVLIIQ